MSNRNHNLSKSVVIVTSLLMILLAIAMSFGGCTYKTYTGRIGDATFSFQYRKNDCVNPKPYDPYSGMYDPPPPIPEGGFYPNSHINVDVSLVDNRIPDAKTSLEHFVSALETGEYIRDLEIMDRDTVTITGLTAEYVHYFYTGYTTVPVPYEGKFASLIHKGYIVDIDVLYVEGWLDTDEAFNLLVKTFKI